MCKNKTHCTKIPEGFLVIYFVSKTHRHQPVDALLTLQVLHSCCYIFSHFNQHLRRQTVTLVPQEGEEIPT